MFISRLVLMISKCLQYKCIAKVSNSMAKNGTFKFSLKNLAQKKIAQPFKLYCTIFSSSFSNKHLFPVNALQFENPPCSFLFIQLPVSLTPGSS